jgi:hypothetical protein
MQQKKGVITSDILKAQASKLWQSLSQYEDIDELKWSNGGLEGSSSSLRLRNIFSIVKGALQQSIQRRQSHK